MKLVKAERSVSKIRLNISSPSGFGKTYSSLLLAYGLTGSWEKIALIDSENGSGSLYSHLGPYNTVRLAPPFTPDSYIEAIKLCEDAGMEVIIIDSITHVWKGPGGVLDYQNSLGGRYQDWAKATPLYQKLLNKILQSSCHIITTCRKKQAYNLVTEGNKTKVEKAGLEDEFREGFQYEVILSLEIINDKHLVKASKDRTGLFTNVPEFVITPDTGRLIRDWCNMDSSTTATVDDINQRIGSCKSIQELLLIYNQHPHLQSSLKAEFEKQKRRILLNIDVKERMNGQQKTAPVE